MNRDKGLRLLLLAHGAITLSAAFVLAAAPDLIPSLVGIHLEASSALVAYLLAGAEFGFAVLSFGASRLTDPRALRLIAWTFIAFHGLSGILECYAYMAGEGSGAILGNVLARIVIAGLFFVLS